MTVFSKILLTSTLVSDALAAPQRKHQQRTNPLKSMLFMSSVPATMSSAVTGDALALQQKHTDTQAELTDLLENDDAMLDRFESFMTKRYGKVCKDVEITIWGKNSNKNEYETVKECKDFKLSESTNPELHELKFGNFQTNVKKAFQRNQYQKTVKVVHGITSLMDLSRDEFRQLLGYKPSKMAANEFKAIQSMTDAEKVKQANIRLTHLNNDVHPSVENALPENGDKKDWRDDGAVTPVKDQGHCGSCWAFSTVESMESACIVEGLCDKDDPFVGAPAQLVDCDHGGDQGCNGGLPANAFKYLKHHPLEKESDYPYIAHDEDCTYKKSKGVIETKKATQLSIWGIGEKDMKKYLVATAPLSVAVHATDGWHTYSGGIMTYDECPDDDMPNHAVQAVAVDAGASTPYWVIRNSWNTDWGEDGFIRISYGQNTCNIAFEGYSVTVKKAADAELI